MKIPDISFSCIECYEQCSTQFRRLRAAVFKICAIAFVIFPECTAVKVISLFFKAAVVWDLKCDKAQYKLNIGHLMKRPVDLSCDPCCL